ncbi:DUF6491 family protein [Glaciecola sp. 1036]|uniref:DUF6491 family protein n=1 Tax=Alteromonadaceae TaxID=72275 RepID=UPI003D08382A
MKSLLLVLVVGTLLTGCASSRLSDSEMESLIENYIKENAIERKHTVPSFKLISYSLLSDQYLMIRSSLSRYLVVKLFTSCDSLNSAPGLVIKRQFGSSLSEGTDYVFTPDSIPYKCTISQIYPFTKEQYKDLQSVIKTEIEEKELLEEQDEQTQPQ